MSPRATYWPCLPCKSEGCPRCAGTGDAMNYSKGALHALRVEAWNIKRDERDGIRCQTSPKMRSSK